jgi:hypothetical protein
MCGGKKDGPGLKLDTSRQTLHDMRARPKVSAAHSESNLTVFANGHHRPCHRNNNSAHLSGLPYQLSRPQSLHGTPAFASPMQGNNYNPAEVSRDTHSLVNNDFHTAFGSTPRSTDLLPITPMTGSLESAGFQDNSNFQDYFQGLEAFQEPLFTGRSTTFGQGGNSPTESHMSETIGGPWPWSSTPQYPYENLQTSPSQSQDCLPSLENEWAIPSADLVNPSWSAGDLPLDPNKLSETLGDPISHSGESKQSAPGLTASSSPSELGDTMFFADLDFKPQPSNVPSEPLFWEDNPVYRVAPSSVNDARAPTSVPPRSTPESQPMFDMFAKTMGPMTNGTASSASSLFSETSAISMPVTMDDIQNIQNRSWQTSRPPTVYPSSVYANFTRPATFSRWR